MTCKGGGEGWPSPAQPHASQGAQALACASRVCPPNARSQSCAARPTPAQPRAPPAPCTCCPESAPCSVCVCACVCVRACVHAYLHACARMGVHVSARVCVHVCVRACTPVCGCAYNIGHLLQQQARKCKSRRSPAKRGWLMQQDAGQQGGGGEGEAAHRRAPAACSRWAGTGQSRARWSRAAQWTPGRSVFGGRQGDLGLPHAYLADQRRLFKELPAKQGALRGGSCAAWHGRSWSERCCWGCTSACTDTEPRHNAQRS